MKILVIDNNVLFSLMNPLSTSSYLFSSIYTSIIAPEFIKDELEEHKEECLTKSHLSEEQFNMRLLDIQSILHFIPIEEYKHYLPKAISLISDPDDIDILALALSKNADIWSNDFHFKEQSLIKVHTTNDILNLFLAGRI